jgi:hypothetical protein
MYRLTDGIISETTGGMVGPMTTSGNPSVAYLPGQFTSTKNMLRSLSTVKKKWKIEVLETADHQYNVSFENQMNIVVPAFAYAEFNEKVLKVAGKCHVDLTEMINEAKAETIHKLYGDLTQVLAKDLREVREVVQTVSLLNFFVLSFKNSQFVPMESKVAIQLHNFDADVKALVKRIQNIYEDDIGNLQMMIKALKSNRSVGQFEPFTEYDYLAGERVSTIYNGINMVLTLTISPALLPTQSLYIESAEVLDEIEALSTVKVSRSIVFPTNGMFDVGVFRGIKDIIDNTEGEINT